MPISRQHHQKQSRRRLATVGIVLYAMRRGNLSLHFEHQKNAAGRWFLNDGRSVPTAVAEAVIRSSSIVSVGDSLFAGMPGQTYRFVAGE